MQYWKLIENKGQFFKLEEDFSAGGNSQEVQINTGEDDPTLSVTTGDMGFTSYAHPKLAFNFTMSVHFSSGSIAGAIHPEAMTFALKSFSRPAPTINYQDINYYNYRTKVATSIDYGSVNIEFYDDPNNLAHGLFLDYLKTVSPIANAREVIRNADLTRDPFSALWSGIGQLPDDPLGLIEKICLNHFFTKRDAGATTFTNYRMEYVFHRPKISAVMLSEMNMASNDVSSIAMTFFYDGLYASLYKLEHTDEDSMVSG